MEKFVGFLFAKLALIGSKSEGPEYILQQWDNSYKTWDTSILKKSNLYEKDQILHRHLSRKVVIHGELVGKKIHYEKIKNYVQIKK